MIIRVATEEDATEILNIYVESWNEGFGARMPEIEADSARLSRWRHDLSSATPTRWFLAERLDFIAGFVGIGPCRDPQDSELGELDTIAVKPSEWRTGVGRQLMSVAIESLRSEGYATAVLWTLNGYERGESFYLSSGWQRTASLRQSGEQIRYDYQLLPR